MLLASVTWHVFSVHAGCLQRRNKERSSKGRDTSVKCAGANTEMPGRSKWCHGAAVYERPVVLVGKGDTLCHCGCSGYGIEGKKGRHQDDSESKK